MRTLLLFFILLSSIAYCVEHNEIHSAFPKAANGVVFVSTIDGYLRAIDPHTGVDRWSLKEEPVLKAPLSVQHGFTFLPDPQDGGLYLLRDGQLKKLPYSIPQLVGSSPCRSTDGVLYAGSKKDVWLGINLDTGVKEEELSQASDHRQCPANNNAKAIFIGRSEYKLSMFDAESRVLRWNATFTDYSSHLLPADLSYPFQHFASSSDGRLLTVDGSTGTILWERNLGSTIVAIYLLQTDGLHKLPYTVIGQETMEELARNAWDYKPETWVDDLLHAQNVWSSAAEPKRLYPTLYVGESDYGLYAIPAFVDERTITIAPKYLGPPLLEGPTPIAVQTEDAPRNTPSSRPIVRIHIDMPSITHRTVDGEFLLLGYHEPPGMMASQLVTTKLAPVPLLVPGIEYERRHDDDRRLDKRPAMIREVGDEEDWSLDTILWQMWRHHPTALASIILTAFALFLTVAWMCGRQSGVASFTGEARSVQTSKRGMRFWPLSPTNVVPESWVQIGSIFYDPQEILGRGCEGTVVYRGRFDGREVAVKRVVADFVRLVDREVDLLRESDTHWNVIRYFCMESDSLFRYIALELCDATVQDYVEKESVRERCPLSAMEILKQATDGIAYLHSIHIVHRDIKPPNVLLSVANQHGIVRALISDFGLCKRIQLGRNSVSRRSGLAGTDGWIAPEALSDDTSVTCAVDIFSLGCIFYYVLTLGKHPYGGGLQRQSNILHGKYNLQELNATSNAIGIDLIESMLRNNPKIRPSASDVASHPFFWSRERQLQFFSDVSDRLEKEDEQHVVVRRLERGSRAVVGSNWRQLICPALAEDLRKFRTYKGQSVRDLLRAMRNKKHHYRELPSEVRESLGRIPDEFVVYFTSRFPQLLMHTYAAMSVCACEHVLCSYYSDDARTRVMRFEGSKVDSDDEKDDWNSWANHDRLRRKVDEPRERDANGGQGLLPGYHSQRQQTPPRAQEVPVLAQQQEHPSPNAWERRKAKGAKGQKNVTGSPKQSVAEAVANQT